MLKKAMLAILAAALLVGTANLFAQGRKGRPKGGQKQVQEDQQKQKGLRPGQQQFDEWLAALTKAYRENDGEKMGQLLRNMNQRRQKRQKETDAPGKRGQHFRHERWEVKGHPEQWRETKDGRGWRGRGFEHEGKGRGGRAFRQEGMRMHGQRFRGRDMDKQGRDLCHKAGHRKRRHTEAREGFARADDEPGERGRGPRHRGMGREGQGLHHGGMGGWGRGLESQDRWYRNRPPRGMHDQGQDESDFDWDW